MYAIHPGTGSGCVLQKQYVFISRGCGVVHTHRGCIKALQNTLIEMCPTLLVIDLQPMYCSGFLNAVVFRVITSRALVKRQPFTREHKNKLVGARHPRWRSAAPGTAEAAQSRGGDERSYTPILPKQFVSSAQRSHHYRPPLSSEVG